MRLQASLLVILFMALIFATNQESLMESFFKILAEGNNQIKNEPIDRKIISKEYDFIIVGAGTAGCTLARRLTEVPQWKVLLIEAGRPENYLMDIPGIANFLQFTDANWNYKTQPSNTSCLGLEKNQCKWPKGKVMGGSSVLNYMIHTRGNKKDYDNWEAMGNPGWGWDSVLKYFKKMERFDIPKYNEDTKYHNLNGPVSVTYSPYKTKIAKSILEAAREMGEPIVDYNGQSQIGYSYLQLHLVNGTRASASRSYLHPVSKRRNLHVKKYTEVDKLLINPRTLRAYGVEFKSGGRIYQIHATKEVIVSAGTINSPKLLMLSGIGPKEHLQKLKIPVQANLPVGENLMDHISVGGLMFVINKPYSIGLRKLIDNSSILINYLMYHQGPLATAGGTEALAFYDLKNPNDPNGHPQLELLFAGVSFFTIPVARWNFGIRRDIYDAIYKPFEGAESFLVLPMLLLPKSKGRITLRNRNPKSKPLIYANYLAHQEDVDVLVDGVEKTLKLMEQPAMQKMGTRLYNIPVPGCEHLEYASRQYWECQARHLTFTIYHYCGTCKMGQATDPTAVVDARLRVHGVKGLRVIDASIMPEIPAGHTNTPTYMIAEKGADMIKEDWGVSTT